VQRRVNSRGTIMVAGQRITVGIGHAGETVAVTTAGDQFRVHRDDQLLAEAVRTTTKPIARFKARKPELPRTRRHATASPVGLPSTTVTGPAVPAASAPTPALS
jgi:hypothetical protein